MIDTRRQLVLACALPLLLFVACRTTPDGGGRGDSAAASTAPPLRVMTFNIRYNNPGDGVNAWPNRKDWVAGLIRFHDADVVGVQEALGDMLKDLDTRLPAFARVGVGRADGKSAGEFSAICIEPTGSRYSTVVHSGSQPLPKSSEARVGIQPSNA